MFDWSVNVKQRLSVNDMHLSLVSGGAAVATREADSRQLGHARCAGHPSSTAVQETVVFGPTARNHGVLSANEYCQEVYVQPSCTASDLGHASLPLGRPGAGTSQRSQTGGFCRYSLRITRVHAGGMEGSGLAGGVGV